MAFLVLPDDDQIPVVKIKASGVVPIDPESKAFTRLRAFTMALYSAAFTIARSPIQTTTAVSDAGANTVTAEKAPSTNSELAVPRKLRVKDHVLTDCDLKDDASPIAPHGHRYIDTIDCVLLPILYTIRTVIIINQLVFNLARTFFCTPILLNLLSSSMLTFIALEDYVICRLLLTTIKLLHYSSTTTLWFAQTLWLAFSFWPRFFWHLFGPSSKG
jgi:hypothetical protein